MALSPESLYRQLGQLLAETPDGLENSAPLPENVHRWLGRAAALVEQSTSLYDKAAFNVVCDGLGGPRTKQNAHQIITILHRALARAELNAPAEAQGAFIPVSSPFDALRAVSKVLGEANSVALIVDAYMDAKVLTDFATLTAPGVAVLLLTDSGYTKPDIMRPAAARWIQQYAATRPLEVRFTAPRVLHDRLILIDNVRVWSLTQSLKDFAARSPASVLRVDGDLAKQKLDAYQQIWIDAKPL